MTAHSASPPGGLVAASREEAGNAMMTSPTKENRGPYTSPGTDRTEASSSCSDGVSTGEACQADAAAAPSAASDTRRPGIKTMKVTVTVLSLHGCGVTSRKKKKKRKAASKDSSAAIVASFSQSLTNETSKVFLTHVPSLQTQLDVSTDNSQPVFNWPADESSDDAESRNLSTLEFTRSFVRESGTTDRYVAQTCPVNLSIQRGSKLALLGKANLIINGEENGASSITVPIVPVNIREKSTVKKLKNKATMSQSDKSVKVKGDIFQFQLDGSAMLRVSVHVSDPSQQKEEQSVTTPSCITETVECQEDVYEDDDDSSLEQDDYAGCILENNELRLLRQELARSEQTNNVLQIELATAQQYRAEAEKLRFQLDKATSNAESLLDELNKAKSESDLVPFYETRVNELLAELRNRDLEVHCLKDEVEELKGQWKKEQVGSLLWESEFEETSASSSPVEDDHYEEGGEGESCTEGGGWGVRRLGASLLSIEERLRAQQRKVREEQQRMQQEGLSTSRHGKAVFPLERVDEEAEEQKDVNEDCSDDVSEQSDGPETRIDPLLSQDTKEEGASADPKDIRNFQKHADSVDTAAASEPKIDSAEVLTSMSEVDSLIWDDDLMRCSLDELEKKSSNHDDGSLASSQASVCPSDKAGNTSETEPDASIPGEHDKGAEVESGQSKLEEIKNAPVRGWGVRRIGAGLRGLERSMRDQQRRHQEQQRLAAAAMSEESSKVLKRHTFHGSGEELTEESILEKSEKKPSVESSAPESDAIELPEGGAQAETQAPVTDQAEDQAEPDPSEEAKSSRTGASEVAGLSLLGMLLGSPAPSCLSLANDRGNTRVKIVWEDDDGASVPSLDNANDGASISSVDGEGGGPDHGDLPALEADPAEEDKPAMAEEEEKASRDPEDEVLVAEIGCGDIDAAEIIETPDYLAELEDIEPTKPVNCHLHHHLSVPVLPFSNGDF